MLYFAYGSNLNHLQMKRRCKDSCFIKSMSLKGYVLTFRSKYGAADIERKKKSKVLGALYEISGSDEKQLDIYEDYPIVYKKMYFQHLLKIYSQIPCILFQYCLLLQESLGFLYENPLPHLIPDKKRF